MSSIEVEVERISTDVLIIGGGTAGCFAGVAIREMSPGTDVLVVEKAHIKRSGCLAAGVNAINAYLNPGETPETYLQYVRQDSAGLVRDDLVFTIGERLNKVTGKLESWGLPFPKDESGQLLARGKRNVEILGESIKPVIAAALVRSGARVLNRAVAANYIMHAGKVVGVYAFSARSKKFYIISAKAVICAAGGASGIYRPNNGGTARHKLWYCPFNVGTGLAMGLRAGAEMTTFEMRFIALRIKDVLSPTGTVAQGVRARQVNGLGDEYLKSYRGNSTSMRTYATVEENKAGRGPCYLDFTHITDAENLRLKKAYLSMSPAIVLKWADEGIEPNGRPMEICGSEPHVVGGHGQAGYWIDPRRRSTVPGLFAAGDVAGGSPKKYVTGCFAEAEIAAETALDYIKEMPEPTVDSRAAAAEYSRIFAPLKREGGFTPDQYEERLQKIMDEYAGGISANYELCESKLLKARQMLITLSNDANSCLVAANPHQLMEAHEVIDRILVARALVEHLLYRKETRWRSYQERLDYPKWDDRRWLVFVNSLYDRRQDGFTMLERHWARDAAAEGFGDWDDC